MAHLLTPEHRWECPQCGFQDVTYEQRPHSRFHECGALKGMPIPMVPAGTRAKVELVEREDWVGDEKVRTDAEGGVWMAARVTRDEGEDVAVYAPTATVDLRQR